MHVGLSIGVSNCFYMYKAENMNGRRNIFTTDLDVPDVDTLVEGAAGDVPTIRTERHAVDGF